MKKSNHSERKGRDYLYHPFEMIFSGLSGSGKTTLLEKLIQMMSTKYRLAYVKHDAHQFEMDRPGKDSYRARAAGAASVLISDQNHSVLTQNGQMHDFSYRAELLQQDFCLIEGHKTIALPKIIIVDEKMQILDMIKQGQVSNVLAYIVPSKFMCFESDVPVFHRDSILEIMNFVENSLLSKAQKTSTYGLVLTGGKSTRMGRDKGAIDYHGISQTQHIYQLLSQFTEKCFVSCRADQGDLEHLQALPQIHDKLEGIGPAGGILSAMLTYPSIKWLVLAVDLPLITPKHIQHLLQSCHPFAAVSGYVDANGLPEPLAAIYRPEFKSTLFSFIGRDIYCPRKMLLNSNFSRIPDLDCQGLTNANTPEDFSTISAKLKNSNNEISL